MLFLKILFCRLFIKAKTVPVFCIVGIRNLLLDGKLQFVRLNVSTFRADVCGNNLFIFDALALPFG